jgi:hypothetical protein
VTSATPWLGTKRVAFVPLFRTVAAPPDQIPANWEQTILARVLYNPRPEANGADRSLRAWVRAASSGRADIDPVVLPMRSIDRQVVEADDLEGELGDELRDQGMDAAVLVMLGDRGAGTNRGFWSRVVMLESNGVWLMEIIHGLTGFKDLYHFNNDTDPLSAAIDSFDEMSASSQTHPTAFTKHELGWLDEGSIVRHGDAAAEYELQDIGFAQPPVAGRVSAVQIGGDVPYVLVESRSMNDQFEAGMPSLPREFFEYGIAGDGVIAYRVQAKDPTVQERPGGKKPLYLMTPIPLQPGASTFLDDGVRLTVTATPAGGAGIRLDVPERRVTATIVWHHDQTGETQLWLMNGEQLVRRATVLGEDGLPAFIGPPFRIVGVADMDGDGRSDIVWHHDDTGETQLWLMNGEQLVRRATVLGEDGLPAFIGPPFRIVGVADMDGDGRSDIVWHRDDTGETQLWLMNGEQLVRRATVLGEDGLPAFIGPPFRIVGVVRHQA